MTHRVNSRATRVTLPSVEPVFGHYDDAAQRYINCNNAMLRCLGMAKHFSEDPESSYFWLQRAKYWRQQAATEYVNNLRLMVI
jgi:hypothetical protein